MNGIDHGSLLKPVHGYGTYRVYMFLALVCSHSSALSEIILFSTSYVAVPSAIGFSEFRTIFFAASLICRILANGIFILRKLLNRFYPNIFSKTFALST